MPTNLDRSTATACPTRLLPCFKASQKHDSEKLLLERAYDRICRDERNFVAASSNVSEEQTCFSAWVLLEPGRHQDHWLFEIRRIPAT